MRQFPLYSFLAVAALVTFARPASATFGGSRDMETAPAFERVELVVGDPEKCAPLLSGIATGTTVTLAGLPAELDAGQTLAFTARIDRSFTLPAGEWQGEYGDVSLRLVTSTPYPTSIPLQATPDPKSFFLGTEPSGTFAVSSDVAENVGGLFGLRLSVTLYTRELDYCMVHATLAERLDIRSDSPDLTPPLVTELVFDKTSYRPGDTVTVQIRLSEPLSEPETDHLEFVNPATTPGDPDGGFPGFLGQDLSDQGGGLYVAKFSVPATARPGNHHLAWFNRQDVWGNFEDQVGRVDANERAIAKTAPLVVGP